ncbi:MAG: nucleoside hydrolase [Acidimicrobiia bacterium]
MSVERWSTRPRMRIISDNDYGGDPDGLVQLAHLLLSPSVDVAAVIGSHLRFGDPFDTSDATADHAAAAAGRVAELCHRHDVRVVAGANTPLSKIDTPAPSPAAEVIVAEAMRDDTDLPLFVTCGGGLTEIASAWLMEPRIADRLILIWIGGCEHAGMAEPPPGGDVVEYNTAIDPLAAQVVFNESDLPIWQVPRDVYRTTLASWAEMRLHMAPHGSLGHHLFQSLADVTVAAGDHGLNLGETYILGDSPLVLLTALQSSFEPAPSSSRHIVKGCPRMTGTGGYQPRHDGRPLRVYTSLDNRLLLEDLWAKLALHALQTQGDPT